MDVVDLYWLHRDDETAPVGAIVETLAGLVKEGAIRGYGASNWSIARIEAANDLRAEKGVAGLRRQPAGLGARRLRTGAVAGRRHAVPERARSANGTRKRACPSFAYSAQARGYFGTVNVEWARGGFAGEAPKGREYDCPEGRRRLLAAMDLAARGGCTPSQIALAYLLHQPFPVYPLIGTGRMEHLRDAMDAQRLKLSDADMAPLARG